MVKNEEQSTFSAFSAPSRNFKDGAPGGSLWSREYDLWKSGDSQVSGFGRSMGSAGKNSSSSSGSDFNWDKAVNDAFKDKQNKK